MTKTWETSRNSIRRGSEIILLVSTTFVLHTLQQWTKYFNRLIDIDNLNLFFALNFDLLVPAIHELGLHADKGSML